MGRIQAQAGLAALPFRSPVQSVAIVGFPIIEIAQAGKAKAFRELADICDLVGQLKRRAAEVGDRLEDLGYNPMGGAPLPGGRIRPDALPANLQHHYTYHPRSAATQPSLPPITINFQPEIADILKADFAVIGLKIGDKIKEVWSKIEGDNQKKYIIENMVADL